MHETNEIALHLADEILRGSPFVAGELPGQGDVPLKIRAGEIDFNMGPDGIDLGREAKEVGIVVADSRVSRRHARFVRIGGGIAVMDLGSTNGTVIRRGGKRLAVASNPVQLVLGDRVVTLNDVLLVEVVAA